MTYQQYLVLHTYMFGVLRKHPSLLGLLMKSSTAAALAVGVVTVLKRTPPVSPSRMNGYAGWSRVTGAIPCARASAQLTRPFRLSSHAAIASGNADRQA